MDGGKREEGCGKIEIYGRTRALKLQELKGIAHKNRENCIKDN